MFGKETAAIVFEIVQMHRSMESALSSLSYLGMDKNALSGVTTEQEEADEEWQNAAIAALEKLGMRRDASPLSALLLAETEPGEKKLGDAMTRLENVLRPYIELSS
jgi:hypothetical protein